MKKIENITKNTFAAHLDDGRVFILSNAIDGSLSSTSNHSLI